MAGLCKEGSIPGVLPMKGYSQFKPLPSINSGTTTIDLGEGRDPITKTIYQHQFQTDEDIQEWQLKKSCHWEMPAFGIGTATALGAVGSLGLGGGLAIGVGVPAMEAIALYGTFEYKIVDLSQTIIFWSRVNLTLVGVILVNAALGGNSFGAYTATLGPDRSVDWRSRKSITPPIQTAITKPYPPVLMPALDADGIPVANVRIYHHGMPTNATKLYVERAQAADDPSLPPPKNEDYVRLDGFMQPSNDKTSSGQEIPGLHLLVDKTATRGKVYFYRIVAEGSGPANISDAVSTLVYDKTVGRTIIETFVIDGKPTVNNPDLAFNGSERLTYDDYAEDHIVYPKNREETFLMCPPEVLGTTVGTIKLDFDWYGPIYKSHIPSGSILKVIMDGISFGTWTQRGRTAEWQFSAKTEGVLWGVISDVAGRLIQASPQASGVALVTGSNVGDRSPFTTNKANIIFINGNSAFLMKTKSGIIYAFVTEDRKLKVYYSMNGGKSFEVTKNADGTDFQAVFGQNNKLLDITQDNNGIIYLLVERQGGIYITRNIDQYTDLHFVWPADGVSSNARFELGGQNYGPNSLSIVIGNTIRVYSVNNGTKWQIGAAG